MPADAFVATGPDEYVDAADRGTTLFTGLGTFWSDAYAGRGEIRGLIQGLSSASADPVRDFENLDDFLSVNTVKPFTCRSWWLLPLDAPLRQTAKSYDEDVPATVYDQIDQSVAYQLPAGMVDFALVTPTTTRQTKVWWYEQDVRIDQAGKRIVFNEDPLPYGYTDSDGRSFVWIFRPRFTADVVYDHAGYIVNRREADSVAYKDFVQAAVRTRTQGASVFYSRQTVAAAVQSPIVSQDAVVVDVADGPFGETVIGTDKEVFVARDGQTATVAAGDQLLRGDTVDSSLRFCEHLTGAVCDENGITHRFTLEGETHWLSFSAYAQPVTRPTPTTVRFPIGGEPAGVEAYWRAVDASGRLATWVTGSTVIPAQLIADRILRYGWVTAEIDARGLSPQAVDRLTVLTLPAASAYRFVYRGSATESDAPVGTVGSTVNAGMTTLSGDDPSPTIELPPITRPEGPC